MNQYSSQRNIRKKADNVAEKLEKLNIKTKLQSFALEERMDDIQRKIDDVTYKAVT